MCGFQRIRERLIAEGIKMEPQFFVGRYGLNKELVKRIRSAFRFFEIVRIELGHPWTDNTTKFAERLELRTGAIVLDRAGISFLECFPYWQSWLIAGSRFLLYRGFTHADLARKGLLDPGCFAVGGEYDIGSATRQPRFYIEKMKARKRLLDAHKANSSQERTAAPIRKGNARQKPGKKAVRPWQSINKTQKVSICSFSLILMKYFRRSNHWKQSLQRVRWDRTLILKATTMTDGSLTKSQRRSPLQCPGKRVR